MKNKITMIVAAAVAMFAASSAKAETYYLKANPSAWTVYTTANVWTNAAGTAITMYSNGSTTGQAHKSDDFIVTNGQILQTYNGGTQDAYYFYCKSLQIGGGNNKRSLFALRGSQLNNCNLVLKAKGAFYFMGRNSGDVSGIGPTCTVAIDSSTTESNPAIFEPTVNAANTYARVNTSITGSGWLNVQNYEIDTSNTHAAKLLEFSSNNSGYTGNIFLRGKNSSNKVTLRGINANSFGGNPETFQSKGLRLSQATLITTTKDAVTTANRGLYIGDGSTIETITALTVNGAFAFEKVSSTLTKTGSNTLKLAGGVQEGAALGIFNITAGTLEIAGSDTVEATFNGAATLKTSGSAVLKPRAASTFSGTLNVTGTSTLDLSNAPQLASAISCAAGTSLVVPASGGSVAKVGSFTASGAVAVTVGDGSPLADGVYEILNTGAAIDAATIANLTCENTASSGNEMAFMLLGGHVLLRVGDVTETDIYVYQGGGESGFFSDAGNWMWGQIPTNGGEKVIIAATGSITNDLGVKFSPLSIEFSLDNTAEAQIYGDKITFQPDGSIINRPAYGADFYAEVDFGNSPVDVSCPGGQRVWFYTMVTGTYPVNHTWLWGNYTLTANTWVLTAPITIGNDANVTAKDVTAAVATIGNTSIINTRGRSVLTVDNLTISNTGAYEANLVGSHTGTLHVKGTAKLSTTEQQALKIWSGSGACTGAICLNKLEYANKNGTDFFDFNVTNVVFGKGGLVCTRGRLHWKDMPSTWHAMDDFSIGSIDYVNGKYNSVPSALKAFAIDTTDWFDNTVGRTVTMTADWKCSPYTCPLSAFGVGTNVYNVALDKFTGGFTASNGVTVVLKSGARPGNGSVTMKGGTTLAVMNSVTSAAIGGSSTVTLEADSVLAFNFSTTNTAPVLAFNGNSTLALPESGSVKVKVTSDASISSHDFRTIEHAATPYVLTSGGKFPANAVSSGKVVLAEGAPTWIERLAVNGDGNLALYVRAPGLTLSVR